MTDAQQQDGGEAASAETRDRLAEAARAGTPLALILAVRGKVWPVAGKHGGKWRMRTARGHVFTFRPEFVVAFEGNGHTLVAPGRAPRRRARTAPDGNAALPPATSPADA